jgi:hypothetical protein
MHRPQGVPTLLQRVLVQENLHLLAVAVLEFYVQEVHKLPLYLPRMADEHLTQLPSRCLQGTVDGQGAPRCIAWQHSMDVIKGTSVLAMGSVPGYQQHLTESATCSMHVPALVSMLVSAHAKKYQHRPVPRPVQCPQQCRQRCQQQRVPYNAHTTCDMGPVAQGHSRKMLPVFEPMADSSMEGCSSAGVESGTPPTQVAEEAPGAAAALIILCVAAKQRDFPPIRQSILSLATSRRNRSQGMVASHVMPSGQCRTSHDHTAREIQNVLARHTMKHNPAKRSHEHECLLLMLGAVQ